MVQKEEDRIEYMRDRLRSEPKPKVRRHSIAADVRELRTEIREKRAAGWTWPQIAHALYGDEGKAAAVRSAYQRSRRGSSKGSGRINAAAKASATEINVPPDRRAGEKKLLVEPSGNSGKDAGINDAPAATPQVGAPASGANLSTQDQSDTQEAIGALIVDARSTPNLADLFAEMHDPRANDELTGSEEVQ